MTADPRTRHAGGGWPSHSLGRSARAAAALALVIAVAAGWAANRNRPVAPAPAALASSAATRPSASDLVDLTWVSTKMGWALFGVPCGQALCPRIARTSDGGTTWTELTSPPAHLLGAACTALPCVDHLRFATATIGYLFGPSLFVTRDGGITWTQVHSPPVESLEPAAGGVVRIVYDHSGCPGPCQRTVEAASAASNRWRVLLAKLPPITQSDAGSAQLIRGGADVIYVPIYGDLAAGVGTQQTTIYRTLDRGRTWRALDDPCGGSGRDVRVAIDLAAAPGGFVAALCATRYAHAYSVITSNDRGRSWGPMRSLAAGGDFAPDLIAVPRPHDLVLSNSRVGGSGAYTYELRYSGDDGKTWKTVVSDREQLDPGAPADGILGFETPAVGRWVGDPRAVWTTTDGGQEWNRRLFPQTWASRRGNGRLQGLT